MPRGPDKSGHKREIVKNRFGIPAKNPDGSRNSAYFKAYYEANKEKVLSTNREWRKSSGFKNPRSGVSYRKMAVNLIIERDGSACFVCGLPVTTDEASIEHAIQFSHGGDLHSATNLRISHPVCNMTRPRRKGK